MVGPNYKEPAKPIAPHWPEKNATVTEKPFRDALWWQVFHDPILTSLINKGYHNNLILQIAGVNVLQNRALLALSVGELYPQAQAAVGNYTYNRIGGSDLQSILPTTFDSASLGVSASWELDFWGKYRRAIQSNDAAFLASLATYDGALVTLTSDIATVYIKIRTTQKLIQVTKENITVQKWSLKIALARFNAGEVGLVDVEQAKAELAQTEASLPPLYTDLQKGKDTLAFLLGTVPGGVDTELNKGHGIPKAPYSVAVGIPRETIARRPDIHSARLHAVQQGASIGAIKANLYPALSLVGNFNFSATTISHSTISDMFNWANRNGSAGPQFTWPLLNYGQLTNAVRVQDSLFQEALLSYINLVLQAQKEVQDNITSYIEAKSAVFYLTQANTAATKTLKLTIIRYQEGETDFTPVLNAEQQLLSIQTSLTNAQGDIPEALVALYRALGGGWQIRSTNDVIPNQMKKEMAKRTNWGTLLKQKNHVPPMTKKQRIQELYLPKW
jgi:NodT family efflux transporter outer membrane factor (OMF) lipoprotein